MCGQLGHVSISFTVPQQAKVRRIPPPITCLNKNRFVSERCARALTFPVHLQLSDGLRVWDVSAGQSHSLLLADGDCVQPVLLYCGQQSETTSDQRRKSLRASPSRAEGYTVRPTLLPVCLEVRGRRTGRKRRTSKRGVHLPVSPRA